MNPLSKSDFERLLQAAAGARQHAYAPYSKFPVGAAVMVEGGMIYSGCNIENSSFGLTLCAERVALFKSVSEGSKKFEAVALITGTEDPVMPCGACRQVLAEFNPEMIVVSGTINGKSVVKKLSELLPDPFDKNQML
jgi:cytidine deaminase